MSSGTDSHFDFHSLDLLWEAVKYPGLTQSAKDIDHLKKALPRRLSVFDYKQKKSLLWTVFVGGTGTGKSTLFNALCGSNISETGVERPKTTGAIVYVHKKASWEAGFPFLEFEIKRDGNSSGESFTVVEHAREDISHLVLADTPDLDSLEIRNRRMAEDLYLLSDIIVFVASQEKYADEVPSRFFNRIHQEGKPYFIFSIRPTRQPHGKKSSFSFKAGA